jgi:hypothetical protein
MKMAIKTSFTAAIDRRPARGGDRDGHKAVDRRSDRGVKKPIVLTYKETQSKMIE